jgi:SsrA-binding protein
MKTLINNKKAGFNYFLEDRSEAGMQLLGWEVRSLKNARGSLDGSFVKIISDEAFLVGCKIPLWDKGYKFVEMDEIRNIKLLLKKREILELQKKFDEQGYSIVPTKIYEDRNKRLKIEISTAKGKKNFDKRRKKAEKDFRRLLNEQIKL